MNYRKPQVRVVQQQSEEVRPADVSDSEKEALLAKYYPEQFKKQNGVDPETKKRVNNPKPDQKRNGEGDLSKTDQEFVDVKYAQMDLDDEPYADKLNLKIEIRSNMKF